MAKNERRLLQAGGVLRLYTFDFVKVEWRRVKEVAAKGSGTTRCDAVGVTRCQRNLGRSERLIPKPLMVEGTIFCFWQSTTDRCQNS